MTRLRSLLALLGVLWCSCASDGGPVGTGISTISGNVVSVQTDTASTTSAAATAAPALPPIQVSIDRQPDATTMADDAGNFVLSGHFEGNLTLRFTVPQFQVTQLLDVPAGSAVVLQDIELQPDGVTAQAARQLGFFGTVDFIDCADGTLLMHERRAHGMQFLVHLNAQTGYVDASGAAQSCAAIRKGGAVNVDGSIAYATDRTITALVVTVAAAPPPPSRPQLDADFAGAVAALDCGAGLVIIDDAVQRTSVQLTAQTQIKNASGPLACDDLALGDPVRGAGQITLSAPGLIVARQLTVLGPPPPRQPLRFSGVIAAIDCTSGVLELDDIRTTIDVQLSAATMITGRGGQVLSCADLGVGNRVSGTGQASASDPGTLDALQITFGKAAPGHFVGR